MLFISLFFALTAPLVVATPLPAHCPTALDSTSRNTLHRRAPPKFEIQPHIVPQSQRQEVLDKMREHYETKATDTQKQAKLATAATRWTKHLPGREFMTFHYCEGDTIHSPVIQPQAEIYRDKPVPKVHFLNVMRQYQEEMKALAAKRYNDLGSDRADEVKSMKAWSDWHLEGGIREKTKLTFHSTLLPAPDRTIGSPATIYRPLTLHIPHVHLQDRFNIDESVRAAHTKMVADHQDHPARTSNYGTVHSGWHDSLPDANGKMHRQVVVGLEEVSEDEKLRKHLGNYAVRKGPSGYKLVGLNTGNPSSQAGISHAGPLHSNNEVTHTSNSQEQQHSNVGSPSMHALSSNPESSHLNSQESSQLNAGTPSSHPGPSHPELLHPVSPQQPPQAHTGSPPPHNEFYMPSPEVWRPWDSPSQPSHGTWQSSHSDLYSDQLWHAGSPHIPSNSQIRSHPNSPSSQFRVGSPGPSPHPGSSHASHSELLHPVSPQQPLHPQIGSPPPHNEFYVPSPEVWRPWDPLSQPSHDTWQSSHTDLYSYQLWHHDTGSPHIPSNDQILPHPNSPSSHPGLPHGEPAQTSSAVMSSRPLPQVDPSSNPSRLLHPGQQGAELSPEIWHLLNPDLVYPYPWNPGQQSP